jgi:hypothetical protein
MMAVLVIACAIGVGLLLRLILLAKTGTWY